MENNKTSRKAGPPKIWWVATVLVVLLATLFFVAHKYEQEHVLWPWVLAFAEAGLVGGLADWFAVSALFRHPLGLPLAHTAILRKERVRITENIAEFVSKEVFNQKSLEVLLADKSPTYGVIHLLKRSTEKETGELWSEVKGVLPVEKMAQVLSDDIETHLTGKVQAADVLSGALETFLQRDDWKTSMLPMLVAAREKLPTVFDSLDLDAPTNNAYGPSVFGRVKQAAVRLSGQAMVDKLSKQIAKAEQDQDHKIWDGIHTELSSLLQMLKTDDEMKCRVQEKWSSCLKKADLDAQIGSLFSTGQDDYLKQGLKNQLAILSEDENFKEGMDQIALEKTGVALESIQEDVKKAITSIIASWDVDDWIVRLEEAVGNDLQYIRINGTLIGGSVGVLLHWVKLVI